jgi:hypothetical protein
MKSLKGHRQVHATISKELFIELKTAGILDREDFDAFVEQALRKELAQYEERQR